MDPAGARRLWTLFEPYHAVTYFAPEVTEAWNAAGVRGFWRSYFAGRAAPLAGAPAEVVRSVFFGFAPDPVARAIPSVWDLISPERAVQVRVDGAVAALDAVLGPVTPEEERLAPVLRSVAEAATVEGRALFAANSALPWPEGVRAAIWHAATLLREHRGDAHNAALVAADLDAVEALVLFVAAGPLTAARMQQVRGWTEAEWAAGVARLAQRGLVDATGGVTAEGSAVRARAEEATDRAASRPWTAVGEDAASLVDRLLAPVIAALSASDVVPDPNPMGVPRP